MNNQITKQLYFETQSKLETIINTFMVSKYGDDYQSKLSYTYEDWDLFKTHTKGMELGKTFLLTYQINNIEINNETIEELYNKDYDLSQTPFDLNKILELSENILELSN